jgi:membrane protein YdbS with pleckstrin-like domain
MADLSIDTGFSRAEGRHQPSVQPMYKFRCRIGFWQMIGHLILWLVLILVTLGIGAFFFGYSFQKLVINHTEVVSRKGELVGRLRCDYSVVSSIGHVVLWIFLSIITLGIAFIFYMYRVSRVVMEETYIEFY